MSKYRKKLVKKINNKKILCTSIVDDWGKDGFVGCSSRSDNGYCMRIDDPHCRYQKKVEKVIKK